VSSNSFKIRILTSVLAGCTCLCAHHASALSLMQAYEAALSNDPTYQAARYENEAGQQNRAMGRASLLPTASASYSTGSSLYYDRHIAPNASNPTGDVPAERFKNMGASVSVRQPIFSLDAFARFRQGAAQADFSDAVFSGRSRELIVRVVGAYADAQYADDQLTLATAQRDAYTEQMKVNQRMFELGEGTKTDVLETQAKAELAEAQVIEARDNLVTARNTLAGIVGQEVTNLDALSSNFPVQPMRPATIDEWRALAMEKNAEIIAQRHNVEVTNQEVNKNRAGHFPRLDAVASISNSKSETVNTLGQDYRTRSAGLQLSIPLFSGGYVNAATTQAAANHNKAKSELDAKISQVMTELRKQYGLVTSGAIRIQALSKAVESARLLIIATEKSIQGGVRINLDLLNAQQQLFSAQRDLAQARYNYLLAYLRLRYAAGILTHDDLRLVASYFVPADTKR
jgi:outer membrane protein, protease secretion system